MNAPERPSLQTPPEEVNALAPAVTDAEERPQQQQEELLCTICHMPSCWRG
jgi:hypothetical protein